MGDVEDEYDPEKCDFEDLVPYFDSIPSGKRQALLDNEKYYKEKYGIQTYTNACWNRLKNSKTSQMQEKVIEDEPTYRVIEQVDYVNNFQYIVPYSDAYKVMLEGKVMIPKKVDWWK